MSPAFVSRKPRRNHINNPLKITSNQDIISHFGKKENPLQKYQTGIWMNMGDIGVTRSVCPKAPHQGDLFGSILSPGSVDFYPNLFWHSWCL